ASQRAPKRQETSALEVATARSAGQGRIEPKMFGGQACGRSCGRFEAFPPGPNLNRESEDSSLLRAICRLAPAARPLRKSGHAHGEQISGRGYRRTIGKTVCKRPPHSRRCGESQSARPWIAVRSEKPASRRAIPPG